MHNESEFVNIFILILEGFWRKYLLDTKPDIAEHIKT